MSSILYSFLNFGEDRHGPFRIGAAGPPEALRAALREDDEEGKVLLAVLELDRVADALLDGALAVVAALAGAVQEQDQGRRFRPRVLVRHEEVVLAVAVGALVDTRQEAGLGFAGGK
ncbi:MAG: hypothetical protein L0Y71_23035 [Gemmataceae bacterium]|nr:hypothetical protein [Gemmataceae bacterium]